MNRKGIAEVMVAKIHIELALPLKALRSMAIIVRMRLFIAARMLAGMMNYNLYSLKIPTSGLVSQKRIFLCLRS